MIARKYPVGLDVCENSLKLVQLVLRKNKPAVNKYAFLSMKDACEHIEENTAEVNFETCVWGNLEKKAARLIKTKYRGVKHVNMALKSKDVIIRQLTLPQMPRKELDKAVYFEAKNNFLLGEDYIYDWCCTGKDHEKKQFHILLVSSQVQSSLKCQNIAKASGVKLNAIEVDVFSLYRLIIHNRLLPVEDGVLNLILYIETTSALVVLTVGEKFLFSRNISLGRKDFNEAVAFAVGVEELEAEELAKKYNFFALDRVREIGEYLIKELENTVNHVIYQGDRFTSRGRLLFAGEGDLITGLFEFLQTEFYMRPEVVDPLKKIDADKSLIKDKCLNSKVIEGSAHIAAGLSLRGWQ